MINSLNESHLNSIVSKMSFSLPIRNKYGVFITRSLEYPHIWATGKSLGEVDDNLQQNIKKHLRLVGF